MKLFNSTIAALALAASSFIAPQEAVALEDGDTVRIVIPYRPGGGYDSQGRLAAPYVEAALREAGLPNVNVIVENVTGGGGAIATATVYAAEPDGTTILFLDPESSIWQQALADAPFEVDKFSFIGQMSIDPMVFMIRTGNGMETWEDVLARSAETPILMGTAGKGGYDHIMPIILSEMLKEAGTPVQFDYLHFDGTAPILASMARGEVEGSVEVISTFGDAEENGEVAFLYDFIPNDQPNGQWPDAADVTALSPEKAELLGSAMNYRRVFVAPPGVDADVLATLRAAFEAALTNEELIEKSIESRRPITFVNGEDIAKAIANEAELARQFAPIVESATAD
jgi:tripartite-type tricarboxylate transporter receptor subunit TctC